MRLVTGRGRAVLLGCLLAIGCKGKAAAPAAPPPAEISVLRLKPSEVRETVEYLGALTSRQSVTIVPQIAGYVRKIHVKPGQEVQGGAPLIEVDAREETAALESAQAQQSSASANLELARQTRVRSEALYRDGLVSAQELERARAQAEAAEASARAASAQVSQRKVQLNFHAIKAPFAGTVGDVLVRLGDFVGATTPVTSVAQADVLEVSVAVPSERARTVALGNPLELLDRQGNALITTEVFFVAPQADPRTQLVEVKGAFRNTAGLRPSELVRTRLVYGRRNALQIPALAVVRQSGQAFAFVVEKKDGKQVVQKKPITLGTLGPASYVVEKGLSDGEVIAVSNLQQLREGAQVRVKPASGPSPRAQLEGAPGSVPAQ